MMRCLLVCVPSVVAALFIQAFFHAPSLWGVFGALVLISLSYLFLYSLFNPLYHTNGVFLCLIGVAYVLAISIVYGGTRSLSSTAIIWLCLSVLIVAITVRSYETGLLAILSVGTLGTGFGIGFFEGMGWVLLATVVLVLATFVLAVTGLFIGCGISIGLHSRRMKHIK